MGLKLLMPCEDSQHKIETTIHKGVKHRIDGDFGGRLAKRRGGS